MKKITPLLPLPITLIHHNTMIEKTPKSKLLLIIIGILLLSNIVLLSFLMLNKPAPKRGMWGSDRYAVISNFLKTDIGFSKEQLQQYDTLNAHHRTTIKVMFDSVRSNKEGQLKNLSSAQFSDSAINATAVLSVSKQKDIEVIIFRHFRDIRSICTPEQQPKFDSLFYKALSRKNEGQKK